jgi:hypothetical protein
VCRFGMIAAKFEAVPHVLQANTTAVSTSDQAGFDRVVLKFLRFHRSCLHCHQLRTAGLRCSSASVMPACAVPSHQRCHRDPVERDRQRDTASPARIAKALHDAVAEGHRNQQRAHKKKPLVHRQLTANGSTCNQRARELRVSRRLSQSSNSPYKAYRRLKCLSRTHAA